MHIMETKGNRKQIFETRNMEIAEVIFAEIF